MTEGLKKSGHWPFVVTLIVITAALLAVGMELQSNNTERQGGGATINESSDSELSPVAVRVAKVERRNPEISAQFHGFMAPYVELSLSALVPGQIVEQWVDASDSVKMNQALYNIDDAVYQIDQAKAQASLDRFTSDVTLANAQWERIKNLEKTQSTSIEHKKAEVELFAAQANQRQAEAVLRQTQLQLERRVVVSPINGVVSRIHVRRGEFAQVGQPLIDVIEIDRLKLLVELEDREIVWIKVGQPAILTTQTFPGEQFSGTVQRIFPQALLTSRKFEVEIELPNPDRKLRPGFFMTGSIQQPTDTIPGTDSADILIIPREAVVEIFGSRYCYFVHAPGKLSELKDAVLIAKRTPVVVFPVASNPRVFQLVQGAGEGDLVVTKGLQHLSEETRIHITN